MNKTEFYVKNLKNLIKKTDNDALSSRIFNKRFINYNSYMNERLRFIKLSNYDYDKILKNKDFCIRIRKMLKDFQMDQRGSVLMPIDHTHSAFCQIIDNFVELNLNNIRLENLDLHIGLSKENVDFYIKNIFEYLCKDNVISKSGGIVVASKTMHFIMPELFIMIDSRVMESLHNISDYYPEPNNPFKWYDVLVDYRGETLNRYQGTQNWSQYINYAGALIYYKRIINEWCQNNNSNLKEFIRNDRYSSVPYPSRLIDKLFW